MDIKIDKEVKELIPELSKEELELLEVNIVRDGCLDTLKTWEGILLDGHNRHSICQKHNIEFKTEQIEGIKTRDEAINWIIDNQLGRRNLSDNNRKYLIGVRYRQEKKAQGGTGANQHKLQSAQNEQSAKYDTTASKIAAQNNIAPVTVRRNADFSEGVDNIGKVHPDLKKSIREGNTVLTNKEVSSLAKIRQEDINKEVERIQKEKEEQKRLKYEENVKKRKEKEAKELEALLNATKTKKPIIHKINCMDKIEDIKPIDLLLTDPPYFTDGDFTKEVEAYLNKVKPTGQAYVFAGADPQEVAAYIAIKPKHLVLEQMLVWNYNNTGQRQPNQRYTSNYQVCFYYRGTEAKDINKPADGKKQYACQTINAPDGRLNNRYHKWQKPDELIENIIRNSSNTGDFIFDPFAGSGTTLVVASKLGREAEGCEIDEEAIQICIERGCSRG